MEVSSEQLPYDIISDTENGAYNVTYEDKLSETEKSVLLILIEILLEK